MELYNPPTTKLAFQSDERYHVFLSFRCADVRKTLVDHLYEALTQSGLTVFLGGDDLESGEIIDSNLERAIEKSDIRILIFSKGYAGSVWCLKEAAAMLRTPSLIIPLFYHVDPTHVRYPENDSSPYKGSFLKHSDRYPKEVIDEWKCALEQICSRSGWSTDITQGNEARLVKTVVNDVIKTLDRVPLEVAKHPVGLDTVKDSLIHKLNLNSIEEVVKVGVWGPGGIGKTTLARALFNQIHTNFEAASSILNVRATAANRTGLPNLQKRILRDITKYAGEVQSVDHGINLFRDLLGGKRVLLLLDDVDDFVQLNALHGDWLAPGSRVIITSRDRHVLIVARVPSECIHRMSGLEMNEALQLFNWHAFLRASPSPKNQDLSERIVETCEGHPLSLEVIGSYLYDKDSDRDWWTETLNNIILNRSIQQRLYISYSALTDDEKEIFLDIACFFIGEHKALPIVFWKSLYGLVDSAVSNLSMKFLIKIDDKGMFDMHDHLREMGQTIAEKEKEGTRLWEATHLSTISNNLNCSSLWIKGGHLESLEMLYTPGLRYLHLQNLCIEGMTEDTLAMLSPSLIWLRLESCTFRIGRNRAMKKPRLFGNILQSKIMQIKGCSGLESHSISSLFSLPIIQLQHLSLEGCEDLCNFPITIGKLSQLQHLDLGWCENLRSLPDTTGHLSQLKHLDLRWCVSLISLPETIGNLSHLHHLDLGGCGSLAELSHSIGNLSQLQYLGLGGCINLQKLPDSIGYLSQLQHLDLEGCINIKDLPDSIGELSHLQHLDLEGCINIKDLPASIGNLPQLQHLDLGRCVSLNNLPDCIGNLSQLQHLNLEGCINLKYLPDTVGNLSELQHLNLGWCGSLKNLPDTVGSLSRLQHLKLRGCEQLDSLPRSIVNLPQLRYFF